MRSNMHTGILHENENIVVALFRWILLFTPILVFLQHSPPVPEK